MHPPGGPPEGPDRPAFAPVLVAARAAAGLSQENLAERSGLSVRAIRDLELGRAGRPRRRSAELLAVGLGLAGRPLHGFLLAAGVPVDREASEGLCTLPPAPVLAGRGVELAALDAAADGGDRPGLVVVSGQPGVGKTALALAAGYRLADRFADGQLHVSLRAADGSPLPPADVLARLLTALGAGTGAGLPTRLEERTALYRAQLHRRRVLLVLDDAVDEAQLRPLLPVGDSLAVVTARSRLAGLPATSRLFLDVLPPVEAARMVAGIAGAERCAAEPEALRRLTDGCGGLPLALLIAANRLASRPDWTLGHLVGRLADERRRLTELRAGDLTVRGPLEVSYRQLDRPAATLLRRCALMAAREFDGAYAQPLLDADRAAADSALDELVEASLVEATGPDRYRLHDLTRLFAADRLAGDPVPERMASEDRLDGFVLRTAIRAGSWFEMDPAVRERLDRRPGGRPVTGADEAARWLALDQAHWLAALDRAARRGWHDLVVEVGEALHWYSDRHHAPEVWLRVFALGATAAGAGGRPADEARQRNYLGWALVCDGRPGAAALEHRAALDLARRVGDRGEQAWSLMYLGWLAVRDDPDEAVRRCARAVRLTAAAGDDLTGAQARFYLGAVLHASGRPVEADRELAAAEAGHLARLGADGPGDQAAAGVAFVRLWRSATLLRLGRAEAALRVAQAAADGFRAQRNQRGLARALMAAAQADAARGHTAAAVRRLDAAAGLFDRLAATDFETEALHLAADLYQRAGRAGEARAVRGRAWELAARIEAPDRSLRPRVPGREVSTPG